MDPQTILLAESEAGVRERLETDLCSLGYCVRLAGSESELLDQVAEADGELALVVLDPRLEGEEGLEIVRKIRRASSRLPVVVLSEACSPAVVVEAMRSGAADFLAKPVTREQLVRSVRKAIPPPDGAPRDSFFAANPRMREIQEALAQVAMSEVPVVLRGESGVGKEVLAREIHARSQRADKPFLKINCAALPLELLESELFGYERGAFTGALRSTPGKFEIADGGIILLDEIGDMDFKLQAKLLHVLQDNEFQRLGGRDTVRVNVRVLAATHCDLERAILEQRFREDLYYRLNVISIQVPPLRERREEILPLAELFLKKHAVPGVRLPQIGSLLREALLAHDWPGNIRELENVMRKLLVFGDTESAAQELMARAHRAIAAGADSEIESGSGGSPPVSVLDRVDQVRKQAEVEAILAALHHARWNRKRAARMLNIDYKGLLYKMKKLGIGANFASEPVARTNGAAAGGTGANCFAPESARAGWN